MRQLILLPVLFLAACSGNPPDSNDAAGGSAAREDLFTIRPGPVDSAGIEALSGTFQLLKTGAPTGIPSSGLGGACLVFAAADLGFEKMAAKVCSTNKSCMTGEGEAAAYCDGQTHQCWAKPTGPGNALCNKGLARSAAELVDVPVQPFDASPYVKKGARVRVVACLNKGSPPFPAPGAPCAQVDSNDRIEVMGPVATVK